MKFDIKYGPAYALADVEMDTGDSVQAVSGAMVSMTDGVQIATEMKGGLMKGLKRSVLGGESLFINTFNAAEQGQITLAPPLPGDIFTIDLSGTLLLQSGALLGATADVAFDTKWGGAKTFFSGEGLFLVRCTGSGTVLASSYGAIEERSLGADEAYTIDSGHVVGFEEAIRYEVKKAGSWKTTILGGEGLVARLTGPGRIWMQTRSPDEFLGWLLPKIPKQEGGGFRVG